MRDWHTNVYCSFIHIHITQNNQLSWNHLLTAWSPPVQKFHLHPWLGGQGSRPPCLPVDPPMHHPPFSQYKNHVKKLLLVNCRLFIKKKSMYVFGGPMVFVINEVKVYKIGRQPSYSSCQSWRVILFWWGGGWRSCHSRPTRLEENFLWGEVTWPWTLCFAVVYRYDPCSTLWRLKNMVPPQLT